MNAAIADQPDSAVTAVFSRSVFCLFTGDNVFLLKCFTGTIILHSFNINYIEIMITSDLTLQTSMTWVHYFLTDLLNRLEKWKLIFLRSKLRAGAG